MPKPVIMPKLGFTQDSSEIVRWIKHNGDEVEQGDPIAEVTTDKVNMEVEAPATGILDGLRFQEGDTVPVTEIIAYIRQPNEPPVTAVAPSDIPPTGEKMTDPGLGPSPEVPPSQMPVQAPARPETDSNRITPVAANL